MKNYFKIKHSGMTKEQAIQAMMNGSKVTHRYFEDNEYIYMVDGVIHDENNYKFNNNMF